MPLSALLLKWLLVNSIGRPMRSALTVSVVLPIPASSCGDTSVTELIAESFTSAPNCGALTSSATGFMRMTIPTFGTWAGKSICSFFSVYFCFAHFIRTDMMTWVCRSWILCVVAEPTFSPNMVMSTFLAHGFMRLATPAFGTWACKSLCFLFLSAFNLRKLSALAYCLECTSLRSRTQLANWTSSAHVDNSSPGTSYVVVLAILSDYTQTSHSAVWSWR